MVKVSLSLLSTALAVLAFPALAADQLEWRLGKLDGSSRDFKIQYNAWEYGNCPALAASSAMERKTHVFSYEVKGEGSANPEMPSGLSTLSERRWMADDEIVTGLKLSWSEAGAGARKLVVRLASWSNPENGVDGLAFLLPGGAKRVLNLPSKSSENGGAPQALEVVFPVEAGSNELVLNVVSFAKHYKLQFDCIELFKTQDKPELQRLLEVKPDAFSGVYHPGGKAFLKLKAFNLPGGSGDVFWLVSDAFGKKAAEGKAALAGSEGSISLPCETRGFFKVECKSGDASCETAYVVIEPVKAEYVDDSRFGSDAAGWDGYRMNLWPEYCETRMLRSYLAGVKWWRLSINWFIREPKKGEFDWRGMDLPLSNAEKYKIRVLMTILGTPKWASSTDDARMTCCGSFYYQNYPPRNYQDWSEFVDTLVKRFKGQISSYEIWNEPGYCSAFWCNGSAVDFGALLKTGYAAIKKADPSCEVLPGAPLPPPDFIEEAVKSSGGKLCFDSMSVHYSGNVARDSACSLKWKRALAAWGVPDMPLVNTEEMSWSDKDPLAFSSKLIRTYVHEASLGFVRTFAFDSFDDGSIFGASTFDYEGRPRPPFAAFRTMTHRLERAKYVADLSTVEAEAYLFDREGEAVLVAWSDKAQELSLPFRQKPSLFGKLFHNKNAVVVDIMDVESQASLDNGCALRLKLSSLPVFIEGGDLATLSSFAAASSRIPKLVDAKPGETLERGLGLPFSATDLKLELPSGWTGGVDNVKLRVSIPAGALEGFYDLGVSFKLDDVACFRPLIVKVFENEDGANLIKNGDLSQGSAFWFFPKEGFETLKNGGIDGRSAFKAAGESFFGPSAGVKVRPGEKYAVCVDAKGDGRFGCSYSINDKDGKRIFPAKPSVNSVEGRLHDGWTRYSDVISVTQPDADRLGLAILSNYGDKSGKTAVIGGISLMRLSEKFTFAKAVNQGSFLKVSKFDPSLWAKAPAMEAKNDFIDASCKAIMDSSSLHLLFSVKGGGARIPAGTDLKMGWGYDSVQFAVDPVMECKGRTEVLFGADSAGSPYVWKYANYWTPELPVDLTRFGLMKDAKLSVSKRGDRTEYELDLPLNELYPLKGSASELGFSWLVNCNDGSGRRYVEWSSGISKAKDPALFGLLRSTGN